MQLNISKKSFDYFNVDFNNPEQGTIHSFGTCTVLEIPYRAYAEGKTFLKNTLITRKTKMLELGCGTGRWGFFLAPHVSSYTGVDLNHCLISSATERARVMRLKNLFFVNDTIDQFLLNTNEYFDLIYFAGISLYFSDEQLQVLVKLAASRLSAGGQLVERTTTSPMAHIIEKKDYYAYYRKNKDITEIFRTSTGEQLKLTKSCRSYTFLRGRRFYQFMDKIFRRIPFVRLFFGNKVIIRFMEFISYIISKYSPLLSREGKYEYDHEFFFFQMVGEKN